MRNAILLLPPLFVITCWALVSVNIPDWDDFDAILKHIVLPASDRLTDLFAPHNEHRIVLTKLIADAFLAIRGTLDLRWMMLCGNIMLIAYGFLWHRIFMRKGKSEEWIGIGILWLLLSLMHRENILWAMTSIQNIAVILFALLAILFAQGEGALRLIAAMLCASISTFSSGGGVFVWPCLIMCEWFGKHRSGHLTALTAVAAAIVFLFVFLLPSQTATLHIVQDIPKAGETVLASTTIMNYSVQITPMFLLRHVIYACSLFISLMGSAAAFPYAVFAFGLIVLALATPIAVNFRTYAGKPIFAFLVFLIANAVPCAIFRAAEFMPAVHSRYCILGASILASVLYLTKKHLPSRGMGILMVVFAIVCNAYWFGAMTQRAEHLRKNFMMWPKDPRGLSYPQDRLDSANRTLSDCINRGLYTRPPAKPGEAAPKDPLQIKW